MPSAVIRSHAYDAEREALTIEFTTGRRYIYFGVPGKAYQAFRAAFSKGRHFNAHIRESYDFIECPPQPADS